MENMEKKMLDNRENINFLINTFYARVRKDTMLGPIFNNIIQDWPEHLEKLTDFWEMNLLGNRIYRGKPLKAHNEVDETENNSITMEHFGRWLQLWHGTINEYFTGKEAETAKNRARKMSTVMFLSIFENRKKNQEA